LINLANLRLYFGIALPPPPSRGGVGGLRTGKRKSEQGNKAERKEEKSRTGLKKCTRKEAGTINGRKICQQFRTNSKERERHKNELPR
jgi:hypothetical protein